MQEVQASELELRVGDLVLIDWPRTHWDQRRGRLHELRLELGQRGYGFVLLDGIAVRFQFSRLQSI
jgi:hypothetical protein